jgi:hypothetical protein
MHGERVRMRPLNMFRAIFCPSSGALLNCSSASGFHLKAEVDVFPDHGWKHIHLGFYTETGGCNCSLKVLQMMGKMLPETC